MLENGPWHVVGRIKHLAWQPHKPERDSHAKAKAYGVALAQLPTILGVEGKEATVVEAAQFPGESSPSQKRPQERVYRSPTWNAGAQT